MMTANECFVHYPILSKFSELTHFCSTRLGGHSQANYDSFNLSPFTGDLPDNYRLNVAKVLDYVGVSQSQLIFPLQTHSSEYRIIDNDFLHASADEQQMLLCGVDALITNVAQVCIAVTTADCVPVLLYDALNKVIAVAHAGWRGTCGRIVERTLTAMQQHYNTLPQHVFASIGVSISPQVYGVGEELLAEFDRAQFDLSRIFSKHTDKWHLDLWQANAYLLEQWGVPEQQIEIAGICSYTHSDRFFSARKLGIQSGRILSGIMIR